MCEQKSTQKSPFSKFSEGFQQLRRKSSKRNLLRNSTSQWPWWRRRWHCGENTDIDNFELKTILKSQVLNMSQFLEFRNQVIYLIFSSWCVCVCVCVCIYNACVRVCMLSHFSHVQLCVALWTVAHQAPLSMGFSRQEHWSGLPFPSPMHESEKWKWSRSVVSDSSRPHGLQPTRLLCPWDFPGKNTGVGCHWW